MERVRFEFRFKGRRIYFILKELSPGAEPEPILVIEGKTIISKDGIIRLNPHIERVIGEFDYYESLNK